jgi:pimeloyl-ACP methyl ester carboxylesterase
VVVGGVRLAVARDGAGPPVICLHATGHGGRDFEAFVAGVRDRFEVIRIDWPGQGRSGPDSASASAAHYADLLRGVMLALDLDNPILVGCSIGGAAAVNYASRYGARALVLANPGGLVEVNDDSRKGCRFLSGIFAAGARGAWWFGPLFAFYYLMVLPSPAAGGQRRRIVRAGYETAPIMSQAWASFADDSADQRDMASRLRMPVLIAWAMRDKINNFAANAPAIDKMKMARLVKFEGGHAAFLEQPGQFIHEFLTFTAGLAASPLKAERLSA